MAPLKGARQPSRRTHRRPQQSLETVLLDRLVGETRTLDQRLGRGPGETVEPAMLDLPRSPGPADRPMRDQRGSAVDNPDFNQRVQGPGGAK